MSVQTDLEARTAKLRDILEESNAALEGKGGTVAGDLAGLPAAIEGLEDAVELDALEIEPTGKEIVVEADEGRGFGSVTVAGDDNLVPENVKAGVVIYGVEGEHVGGSVYPVLEVPEEYLEYVEYCRANFYTGDFANLVVWDSGEWIAVSFLMDDFAVMTYDPATTELTAIGWHTCGYTKSTGEWTSHDYTDTESPGGNYTKYIIFASCYIEYAGETLFPLGADISASGTGGIETKTSCLALSVRQVNDTISTISVSVNATLK